MATLRRLALAMLGALLAGAAYQAIGNAVEQRRAPEPGRTVDIGGRRLRLCCTGEGGAVTVVLEAGLGDSLASWRRVQPEIARFARVCSYDRAGYGGSDAGPPPRTSAAIANDLHELLGRAGERPPYALVGHSFGGYNVRVFNGRFPDEVAGLVLVDSPQEDQFRILPPRWRVAAEELRERYQRQARWAPLYVGLGIARVQLRLQGSFPDAWTILQAKFLRARAAEMESMPASAEQARTAGHIAFKPLTVLTAANSMDPESQRIWQQDVQPRLAHLSADGRQIVVANSSHDMPSDRPDAIVEAVRDQTSAQRRSRLW